MNVNLKQEASVGNAFRCNMLIFPLLILLGQISGLDLCSRPLTLDPDTSDQAPLQGQQINTGAAAC